MPQYILQTKELCKKFAHTAAVNRVSMNIQQGDIYGFIGENGAGKTTFMRMVAGLASPTSGTIKLFGQKICRPEGTILVARLKTPLCIKI